MKRRIFPLVLGIAAIIIIICIGVFGGKNKDEKTLLDNTTTKQTITKKEDQTRDETVVDDVETTLVAIETTEKVGEETTEETTETTIETTTEKVIETTEKVVETTTRTPDVYVPTTEELYEHPETTVGDYYYPEIETERVTKAPDPSVTWKVEGEVLIISGTGDMGDYYEQCAPWFNSCGESVKKIIIEDGITGIGENAFSYFTSLKEVVIPDSVTRIGRYAFYMTGAIENICISSNVTQMGEEIFEYSNIESATVLTTYIPESMFAMCRGLKEVVLSEDLVRIENSAFYAASSLKTIHIPKGVKSIGDSAFAACWGLVNVLLPDSIKSIGERAFADCFDLIEVFIPNSVTSIGKDIFGGQYALGDPAIRCERGSYAEKYAKENDIKYIAE